MGEAVEPDKIRAMIKDELSLLLQDDEFARKMRFGGGAEDRKLVGTKYARWGLSIADVEWLYDIQVSLQRSETPAKQTGHPWRGPSEMLRKYI